MTLLSEQEDRIRRYLLGDATPYESELVEIDLLRGDEGVERLLLIEDELIADYARGAMTDREIGAMEKNFFITPERRERLMIAREMVKEASAMDEDMAVEEMNSVGATPRMDGTRQEVLRKGREWLRLWLQPGQAGWKIAVYATIVIGLGLGVWMWTRGESDAQKGMDVLNQAYREHRPLEARITGFAFAPILITRGNEQSKINYRELDEAEYLIRKAARERPNSESLRALGQLYLTGKDFGKAIDLFEQALRAEPNDARLHNDLGAALLEKSRISNREGDRQTAALELGRSLDELSKAVELDGALLEARFNRALSRQLMGLDAQAEEGWKEYLEKDPSSRWTEEARRNLKLLEERRKKALEFKDSLFQSFLAAYDRKDEAKVREAFSSGRSRAGNVITEQLIDSYLDLMGQRRETEASDKILMMKYAGELEFRYSGDRFTQDLASYYAGLNPRDRGAVIQARQLVKLATGYYNRSEIESAIEFYSQARAGFQKAGDLCEEGLAESWIGYSYARLSDSEKCLSIFARLGVIHKRKNYRSLHAYSLNAIADAYTSNDEFSKAIEYAQRSLRIAEEIGDISGVLRNLSTLQSMSWHLGKYEESLSLGFRALKLADQVAADPKQIWPFYNLISSGFLALGNPLAALEAQKEALSAAIQSQWPIIRALSYAHLGLIHGILGNHREAIRCGQSALQEGERIEGEVTRLNIIASSQVYLGHHKYQAGDYAGALASYDEAALLCEKIAAQFYLYNTHKGKFLAYLATGDEQGAGRELEKTISLVRKYRPKILEESNKNAFFATGQDAYDWAIDFEYSKRRNRESSFEYSEESRARSLLDARQKGARIIRETSGVELRLPVPSPQLNLAEIQARLPEKTQIIQYAVLPEKLIIWVISASDLAVADQAIRVDDLNGKITNYLRLISNPTEKTDEAESVLARDLHDILIKPIEPMIDRANSICVVPDKMLHYLPFSSLISTESGRRLVEDYTLLLSPSATNFILCSEAGREKEKMKEERILSVGNPQIDYQRFPSLPEIAAAGVEAKGVAGLYQSPTLLIEARATEKAVRKMLKESNVIHIASHSIADEKSPLLSKLLLTPSSTSRSDTEATDGMLHAYELYGLKLSHVKFVVLSACQTGIGSSHPGEGVISLTRPFIAAGAPVVVASYWNVESNTTSEIMVEFHRQRKQRQLPVAAALRMAQLAMLWSGKRTNSRPSTWASFAAVGGYTGY